MIWNGWDSLRSLYSGIIFFKLFYRKHFTGQNFIYLIIIILLLINSSKRKYELNFGNWHLIQMEIFTNANYCKFVWVKLKFTL